MKTLLFLALVALLPGQAARDDVRFRLEGNQSLRSRPLLADLEFWLEDIRENPRDETAREDAAYALETLYRARGFPDVRVTAELRRDGQRREVVFIVVEGGRRLVGEILFEGNERFSSGRLQDLFRWDASSIWGGREVFSPGSLADALAGIRLLYRLDGYLDSEVSVETGERRDPRGRIFVDVFVFIDEGEVTRLEGVDVEGDSESLAAEIRERLPFEPGQPFRFRLPVEARGRVQEILAEGGYPSARVEAEAVPSESPGLRRLRIRFESGPRARLDRVEIRGLDHLREGFVRRRLRFEVGEVYRGSAIEDTRRALIRTGLFRRVTITVEPQEEDPTRLTVVTELEEKDRIRYSFLAGWGSYELGRVGAGVLHRNLGGIGVEGELWGKASFRSEEITARLRYPFLFEQTVSPQIRAGYLRFEHPSFTEQQLSARAEIVYTPNPWWRIVPGYEIRDTQIHDVDPLVGEEAQDDTRAGFVLLSAWRDTRDSPIFPTRGTRTFGKVDYAAEEFGSQLDYVRLRGRFTALWSPWRRLTLLGSAAAGGVRPTSRDELPLNERFFLGGPRSVRSFQQDELGPKDINDDPSGGEAFVQGTAEAQLMLWRELGGAVFYDLGAVNEDYHDLGAGPYGQAVGLGLFLRSPIGPIRLDAALNPDRKDGEDVYAIHFQLGHPF